VWDTAASFARQLTSFTLLALVKVSFFLVSAGPTIMERVDIFRSLRGTTNKSLICSGVGCQHFVNALKADRNHMVTSCYPLGSNEVVRAISFYDRQISLYAGQISFNAGTHSACGFEH